MTPSSFRYERSLVWFRRDLRAYDHVALSRALKDSAQVYCVFCFDTDILNTLAPKDRRVEFIWRSVLELRDSLTQMGGGLLVRAGRARDIVPALAQELAAAAVYCNRDYEPQAIARDADVATALQVQNIAFHAYKDQVIFERDEIFSGSGRPYSVFTPYKNAWLKRLSDGDLQPYPIAERATQLGPVRAEPMPTLTQLGFDHGALALLNVQAGMTGAQNAWQSFAQRLVDYEKARDFPARDASSHLSVHLRFGTISIRELARQAYYAQGKGAQTWLAELIWREFFMMILSHYPRVTQHAFKTEYDGLAWENRQDFFAAWCAGQTGYPIVDAGMRQLNQTGFMHNRLRMITASFLVKDLHIDWRWGERYFATQLLDYDLAANSGNWQWAASTGCDAQPYFRIFNPITQSRRFDPQGEFIKRYCPELAALDEEHIHAPWQLLPIEQVACGVLLGRDYPAPIIDHDAARVKTLAMFKAVRAE